MSLWRFANPNLFERAASRAIPYCAWTTVLLLGSGLVWGAAFTSSDYVQGAAVKIIFVHVPTALMAINAWFMMLVASLVWLVRRHPVSALAARAAAPVGAALTLAAIATGAIWGKPMWGAWWAWDPRLTSFLILFFFYVGYIALWNSIEDRELAADVTSMVCLVGTVFAVLSRYAVNFWSKGLHQGPTLSIDQETHIHNSYYFPLLICIAGFVMLFLTLVLLRTRTEIRRRRAAALAFREQFD